MSTPEPTAAAAPDRFDVPAGFVAGLFGLGGRVACVTRGSGIGAAIAKGLAQAGASVVIVDIDDDGAAATAATVLAQGGAAARCIAT